MSKVFTIFDLIFLVMLIFIVGYFILVGVEEPRAVATCRDEGLGSSFSYETCYDAYSKMIFLSIKRGFDNFDINNIAVSFFDFSEKNFEVETVATGGSGNYKISSERNPKNLKIYLDIDDKGICQAPRQVFVDYCPERSAGSDINATINPLNLSGVFIEIGEVGRIKMDKLAIELAEKERIWGGLCSSKWECSGWEECVKGVQRRTCKDLNDCFIPTELPEMTRRCDVCVEDWECEWSPCLNGVTVPTCIDLRECGTEFNKMKEMSCGKTNCVPSVECGKWSECEVDYDFSDLNKLDAGSIFGTKSRVCSDRNFCALPKMEFANCSMGVDVDVKMVEKCGTEFIGLYDKIDGGLLARIDMGTEKQPRMDIVLDGGDEYCDYCHDGILDGDETRIDCGGSCKTCQ